ncbi:hypothetical protein [Tsuneonella troitsensis]|uniref:hypothetical protein n=1 Tax=Tsuneonella troitsensis TaxID=292222 RepID=UPI000AE7C83D|nr:hypothetical protein [Tsuneonella troitsensis]
MRGRKPRVISALRDDRDEPYVDPHDPKSPGFAERNRVTRYEIMPGIFREDIGGLA